MSRYNPKWDAEPVLEAAQAWIRRCLVEEGSLFGTDALWTREHLQQVVVAFTENPDAGSEAFLMKLERQMQQAPPEAVRLMAELLWVLMLFQSNIRQATKRDTIATVWGWSGTPLDPSHPLLHDDVLRGIGSPGTAYNTLRWRELNYVIGLSLDLATRARDERTAILLDRDRFEAWIASAPQEGRRQFRHLFRYLAFPDHNERIAQDRDRRLILRAYDGLADDVIRGMPDAQQDDALNALRSRLKQETGRADIDFYEAPFDARWKPGAAAPEDDEAPAFELGFGLLRERFLSWLPGFAAFPTDRRYLQQERTYKDELLEHFRYMVLAPLARGEWTEAGEAFLALLTRPLVQDANKPQNIVGWRYIDLIRKLDAAGRAQFAEAMATLLDEAVPIVPRVDAFIARWKEIAGEEQRILPGAQRSITGFCLGLAHPRHHIFLKTKELRQALRVIDPAFNWSTGGLTGADVARVDELAQQVFERLEVEGWDPVDLIDAQGFLWIAGNQHNWSAVGDVVGEEDEEIEGGSAAMPNRNPDATRPPLNRILFGPPGTGKTFHTINAALEVLDPQCLAQHASTGEQGRVRLKARFDALSREGRIRFVTFHQSFSYEDFVEGLRADSDESGALQYRVEPGVFRQICDDARGAARAASDVGIREGARIWKISIDGTGPSQTREHGFQHGEARIGWGEVGDLDDEHLTESDAYQALGSNDRNTLNAFAREIQPGDVLLCISSASEVQAIGVVQDDYRFEARVPEGVRSDYNNVLPVRWLATGLQLNLRALNGGIRFTLKTVYELTRFSWAELAEAIGSEGIRLDGKGPEAVLAPRDHVLIVDEINRGNVSRIFGELITLIEASKRAGAPEQLEVTLPYSKKRFQVPANVYLVGTMNTVDRSLAGLDIALRRRFSFVEMPPRPDLLRGVTIAGVDLERLLEVINHRIEALLDGDHAIGHAYFMQLDNGDPLPRLAEVFRSQVVPLLQEYFFEDWERIAWVLNDHRKASVRHRFVVSSPLDEALFGSSAEGVPDRKLWRLNEQAFGEPESYAGIIDASRD